MFPSHFFFYIVIIASSIIISQVFNVKDKYSDYNTVVLNQIAGIILNTKSFLYDFKQFYSTGYTDFSNYHLISHYLTLADIECLMYDKNALDTCSSYHINDVSVPTNITNQTLQKYTCLNREYGDNNEQCKVRILNYDYFFNRTCINLVFTEIHKMNDTQFLVSIKNDMAAHLLMLLRPVYVTTSMSYMYRVVYENNPTHYSLSENCPRNYTSTDEGLNVIIEKVDEEKVYANKHLFDIDKIKDYEVKNAKIDCTNAKGVNEYTADELISSGGESFPCALTVYYLSLIGKVPSISIDLTNSLTVYFDIDTTTMGNNKQLFELRRSVDGTQRVCKNISVTLVNESIKNLYIKLNEMGSMTYTFALPSEHNVFKIFITYSLDMIQVYAFYDRHADAKAFKYALYETSVVSSWSIKDINSAVSAYDCAVPVSVLHANSFNIPSYYHVATTMKLI